MLDENDTTPDCLNVVGREVKNNQNQTLGEVADLALDLQNGQVVTLLVASDDKTIGVPLSACHFDSAAGPLRVNLSEEQFQAAPAVSDANWNTYFTPRHIAAVYAYFHVARLTALGRVAKSAALVGLVVRDHHAILGMVAAFRINRLDRSLDLMVTLKNDDIQVKSKIAATSVRFNSRGDGLELKETDKQQVPEAETPEVASTSATGAPAQNS